MQGLLITFEGPDGGGKTTQLRLLKEALEERKYAVLATREPGGTPLGDQIRHILLHPQSEPMKVETEVLLYAAARAQHVQEKIRPALEAGTIVLCDRFVDASIAYQGYGLDLGRDQVEQVNLWATGGLKPDRTYLLDVSPEQGRRRLHSRTTMEFDAELDRIESRELHYHDKVREGFHRLAAEEERILLIDATQTIREIQDIILQDMHKIMAPENQTFTYDNAQDGIHRDQGGVDK